MRSETWPLFLPKLGKLLLLCYLPIVCVDGWKLEFSAPILYLPCVPKMPALTPWRQFYSMIFLFFPFPSYDVWLGNARGNKYSLKHMFLKPHEKKFWEFSMDELALFDMPDTVDVSPVLVLC